MDPLGTLAAKGTQESEKNGDNATGIISVTADKPAAATGWYDLNGRRISGLPTQKGVYINNGKKVVIK